MVSLRSLSLICIFSFIFFCRGGSLTQKEMETVTAKFQQKQKQTKVYESDIKQILQLEDMENPIESRGHIYYKAPKSLLIKYDEPADEFTLLLDENLYIKKSNKAVVHKQIDPKANSLEGISSLLSVFQNGAEAFNEVFDVSMTRQDKEIHVLLTPKKDGEISKPEEIETVLGASDYEIHSIRVLFNKGNSILYNFSHTRRDHPMDDQFFKQFIP
jgi:outer membrane lipoprotein-sorting protein